MAAELLSLMQTMEWRELVDDGPPEDSPLESALAFLSSPARAAFRGPDCLKHFDDGPPEDSPQESTWANLAPDCLKRVHDLAHDPRLRGLHRLYRGRRAWCPAPFRGRGRAAGAGQGQTAQLAEQRLCGRKRGFSAKQGRLLAVCGACGARSDQGVPPCVFTLARVRHPALASPRDRQGPPQNIQFGA